LKEIRQRLLYFAFSCGEMK